VNAPGWPLPLRRILLADPDIDPEAPAMQFRLTYAGPLFSASSGNNRVEHKHDIRRALHPQLRAYWDHHPFLREWRGHKDGPTHDYNSRQLMRDELADRFARCGYRFTPLVTREWELYCAINILYVRPGWPGNVLHDIDNRLKTLFDALRLPADSSQLGKHVTPQPDENPFLLSAGG
jgi:hypothetical protein